MRLYGTLQELSSLTLRLSSGKTVQIQAAEPTVNAVLTLPDVVDGADTFVMVDTAQTLTNKTLTAPVLTNAEISSSTKVVIPSQNSPTHTGAGSLIWDGNDSLLTVGSGLGGFKVMVDLDSSQTLFKTLSGGSISSGSFSGGTIGAVGAATSINNISKLALGDISGIGAGHVVFSNASKELASEATLSKSRGGAGADMTNVTFPATGILVTEAGSQTLSNKTLATPILSTFGDFTHTTKPGTNPTGAVRVYAKSDNKLYTLNSAGLETAVGSGGSILQINKSAHGFVANDVGCPLYINSSGDFVKARADVAATAEVAGILNKYIDVDNFEVCLGGEVTNVGANAFTGSLTKGEMYFLSAADAGKLVLAEPSVVGQISKPVGIARTTSSLEFFNMRGSVIGSANARTMIYLTNGTTSNVQNVSTMEAGELAGWVLLDGSVNKYRFYVQAQWAKNGAGTDWNLSYQTTGDTPPAGFSLSIDNAGQIKCTIPTVTGLSATSGIQYALNAPAVGATLPLAIDSTNVDFSTIKAKDVGGISVKNAAGSTTNLFVSDAGNVGIGTSSPGGKLNIATPAPAAASTALGLRYSFGTRTAEIALTGSSYSAFGVGSNEVWNYVSADCSALTFGSEGPIPIKFVGNGTERARIDSGGNFRVRNPTGGSTSTGLLVEEDGTNVTRVSIGGASSSSGTGISIYSTTASAFRFFVSYAGQINATSTSITGISDQSLKENVRDLETGLSEVMALRPRRFDWKEETQLGQKDVAGFIAQEVQEVLPDLVYDYQYNDEETKKSLKMGDMLPTLVKAIQEQQAQIESLRAELEALKGRA